MGGALAANWAWGEESGRRSTSGEVMAEVTSGSLVQFSSPSECDFVLMCAESSASDDGLFIDLAVRWQRC